MSVALTWKSRTPARCRWLSAALGLWIFIVSGPAAAWQAPERPKAPESSVRQRIVSLAPSITEILFAVGAGPSLVGVTEVCNYPVEATALPKVGQSTAATINLERIVALRPDLVISFGRSQQPVVEALRRLNVNVATVETYSVEDVLSSIRELGRLTGYTDQAVAVVADIRARMNRVRSRLADLPASRRPRVFYQVWDTPLMTVGSSTFINQLIELAGGINVFADLEQRYPQVSTEAIVERDPQVIFGPNHHGKAVTPRQIMARAAWRNVAAVRSGRIYLLDGDVVSRPGPRLIEALEAMARFLHPDRFLQEAPQVAVGKISVGGDRP